MDKRESGPATPVVADEEKRTGLPVLRSWPAVYGFVLAVFVVWIASLAILARYYS